MDRWDRLAGLLFFGYGESSIDFRLVCYTNEVRSRLGVASDLRFRLFQGLGRAGIEIPFPQRDLHIKTGAPADERPRD